MTLRLRLRRLLHGWTTRRRLRALTTPPTLPQQIARIHRHLETANRELVQASLLVNALGVLPETLQPATAASRSASGQVRWPPIKQHDPTAKAPIDPAEPQFVAIDYGIGSPPIPTLIAEMNEVTRQEIGKVWKNPHRRRTASDLTFRDQHLPPPPGLQLWTDHLAESGPSTPAAGDAQHASTHRLPTAPNASRSDS